MCAIRSYSSFKCFSHRLKSQLYGIIMLLCDRLSVLFLPSSRAVCCHLILFLVYVVLTAGDLNATDAVDLNNWHSLDDWKCNTPLVKDDLRVTSYLQRAHSTQHILLYGGSMRNGKYSNETWSYSVSKNIWSKIADADNDEKPRALRHHSMVTLCNHTVVLFGGYDSRNRPLNETWIFDTVMLKWQRPVVRAASIPIPAMSGHAAVKVTVDTDSTPSCCNQSVLIFPPSLDGQSPNWSSLWELSCIEDKLEYKWSEIKTQSRHDQYPDKGRPSSVVSSGGSEIIAIALEGGKRSRHLVLWKYRHNVKNWEVISEAPSTSIQKFLRHVLSQKQTFAMFFPFQQRYVITSLQEERTLISYDVVGGMWTREPIFGLFEVYMRSGVAAMFNSYALVYRGEMDACRQSMTNLTHNGLWLWSTLPSPPLRPHFATQRVLGTWKHYLYVAGRQQENPLQRSATLWRLNLETKQWFQLANKGVPQSTFPELIPNSATLSVDGHAVFVIYRRQYPGIFTYFPENGTWSSFDFSKIPVRRRPKERRHHTFVSYNSSSVLLFGGFQGEKEQKSNSNSGAVVGLNDLWMLTFKSDRQQQWQWIRLEPASTLDNGNSTSRPVGRAKLVAAIVSCRNASQFLIYGGMRAVNNQFSMLTDMWLYDLQHSRWILIQPASPGPLRLNLNWKMSAVGVGHQMLLTVGCTNYESTDTDRDYCNGTEPQTTWMYCLEANNWTIVSTTNYLRNLFQSRKNYSPKTLFYEYTRQLLMVETQGPAQLKSLTFTCPSGFASENIVNTPCLPCPKGTYSSADRKICQNCPSGVTSQSNGSKDIQECNSCVHNYCNQGSCILTQRNGKPAPSCQCRFGFTGTHCQSPTYYVTGLALIIVVTAICFSVAFIVSKWRKRRLWEGELRRQVQELTSVWQIGHSEIQLLNEVGTGGFGKVLKAVYRESVVAVKVLHLPDQDEQTVEFEKEIVFMQTVRHSNIVMFIGAGKMNDGSRFLVTEFMHRGSLRDVLEANKVDGLSFNQQVKFAIDAAEGMEFLHGLKPVRIHRDLKSPNLLVSKQWTVKVADFGLSRKIVTEQDRKTETRHSVRLPLLGSHRHPISYTTKVGTTQWRAPELHISNRYGTSADVYR